jgi:hypothetical protein
MVHKDINLKILPKVEVDEILMKSFSCTYNQNLQYDHTMKVQGGEV